MGESEYSFSLTTFSPSGKLVQIEHALTAVASGATSLGIKGSGFSFLHFSQAYSVVIFCIFSVFYLKEGLKWNYIVGFVMILGAVIVIFKKW